MMRDRSLTLLFALTMLAACQGEQQTDAGFAGLGAEAEGFTQVRPDYELTFPRDHGAHPDYRIEWWYVTANLKDDHGKDWGVQWTLFRQALEPQNEGQAGAGWSSAQVWLGHSAVTHADGHLHADRLARGGVGQAGTRGGDGEPFAAWIDHWAIEGRQPDGELSAIAVSAAGEGYQYQLELQSTGPRVLQGDNGFSRKSESEQASYYYSQPFYQVKGDIIWQGERHSVSGQAWLDREWSSQPLAADQQGWDWFSMHLNSGAKLMLFRLRSDVQGHFHSGTWIGADGSSRPLAPEDIRMTPLDEVAVAGRTVPTRWRLEVPQEGFNVTTSALNDQAWMGTTIPYWEGPICLEGSHGGEGYLEMTGY